MAIKNKIYWEASDGKIFENVSQCIQHIININENVIECYRCKGTGVHTEKSFCGTFKHPVEKEVTIKCHVCHGKKYLEKKIIWE